MNTKQQIFCFFLSFILLSGCVSHSRKLNNKIEIPLSYRFAHERASSIAQLVPIKLGKFILQKSQSSESTVLISLRAIESSNDLEMFKNSLFSITQGYCKNKKTSLVMEQGVSYNFSVHSSLGNKILETIVNYGTCQSGNFTVTTL